MSPAGDKGRSGSFETWFLSHCSSDGIVETRRVKSEPNDIEVVDRRESESELVARSRGACGHE